MNSSPFRGSVATAAGLVTPGALRGPRFRRLFPDIHVPAHVKVTYALLSRAAYLLVDGRGEHLTPARARRDLRREARLTAAGWTVLRFDTTTTLYHPAHVVDTVRAELQGRGADV